MAIMTSVLIAVYLMIQAMFMSRRSHIADDVMCGLKEDMKVFQIKNGLIAISQIEIYGLNNTLNAGQIKKGLNRICEEMSLRYAVFNGVDIKEKTSVIIFSEGLSDKEAGRALGYKVIDGICVVDRIVLRKTELLPALLSV